MWQTIETAPKDGTLLDLWSGRARYCDCFWHEDEGMWWTCEEGGYFVGDSATHWMLTPDPPERIGNGETQGKTVPK